MGRNGNLKVIEIGGYVVVLLCLLITWLNFEKLEELAKYDSSPIDWCETNYKVHEWIAEFWNSVSSIPIAMVAPLGSLHKLIPKKMYIEVPNVTLIYILIVIIGLGSTYFHGTLSVTGQVMDELGIIWLTIYSAFLILPPGHYTMLVASAFLQSVFVAFVWSTTLLALFAPILSHVFVLSCVPFGLYIHIQAYRRSRNHTAKKQFLTGLRIFGFAWTCWLIDRFACSQMQYIGQVTGIQPQLHAVWHLSVAMVAYLMISVCCEFREEGIRLAGSSKQVNAGYDVV